MSHENIIEFLNLTAKTLNNIHSFWSHFEMEGVIYLNIFMQKVVDQYIQKLIVEVRASNLALHNKCKTSKQVKLILHPRNQLYPQNQFQLL